MTHETHDSCAHCDRHHELVVENLDVRYRAVRALEDVSFSTSCGSCVALIGPNGAGKSTLYNLITARLDVSSGEIRLNDEVVSGLTPYQINRKGLSRSFQVTNIFPGMSVFENVRCGLLWSMGYRYSFWHNVDKLDHVNDRAIEMLELIGLRSRAEVPAGVLTYAEQRALEIGITAVGGASVIILDEPTAGMSRYESEQAIDLIERVSKGKTLMMVEHDMSVVFGLADRISVLVYG